MHRFYNQALLAFAALLAGSLLLAYVCVRASHTHVALLPGDGSPCPSRIVATSDAEAGGHSFGRVAGVDPALRFEFRIAPGVAYPFAAAELWFVGKAGRQALVDLSRYTTISFRTRCTPPHTMTMTIPTWCCWPYWPARPGVFLASGFSAPMRAR